MSNLLSSDIVVFPSTSRDIASSRLTTESRITKLSNGQLDVNGYVDSVTGTTISFSILGYYFICTLARVQALAQNDGDSVYATITLQADSSLGGTYTYIVGVDNGTNYTGVDFSTTEPSGAGISFSKNVYVDTANNSYTLKLLTKAGSSFTYYTGDIVPKTELSHYAQYPQYVNNTQEDVGGRVGYEGMVIYIDCGDLTTA